MKNELIKFLQKNIKFKLDYENIIEKPKIETHGDFSLPLFTLSKEIKKNPAQIAKEYEEILSNKLPKGFEKVIATGPYLNFFLNKSQEAQTIIEQILTPPSSYQFSPHSSHASVLLEYPSPNTNKALHLGHVRNILIGNSLGLILEKTGHKIIRTNLNNDRGIAICKSMLGYELFFKDKTPQSLNVNPDEFVSMCYVKFEQEAQKNESLNTTAQEMLVKWENGDKKVKTLWQKVLNWVYEGYNKTYEIYKIKKFNTQYYESEIYDKGKELVLKALKNKVKGFGKEEDGAIYCNLEDIGFDKKYLMRGDGTTLYMTQDLYLNSLKEKDFKADKYVFIVGKEQEYHFKVLFAILERMGFGGMEKNYHFAYGYVYDKDGKKFSSRKGKVIGANWLYNEVLCAAKQNLKTKELTKDLSEKEIEKRAKIIAYGALAFSFLKPNPIDDIHFDIKKALAFEGESGPYIQYTYARIKSVLRKAKYTKTPKIDYNLFNEKEISLLKTLKEFPQIIEEASEKYKISAIANYLIRICQKYNEFYQNSNILKEKEEIRNARLVLCEVTSKVLKEGLNLLDIETLEEM